MDLKGEYRIPADRERVWTLLNDPDVLRACIPGCEALEKTGDNAFSARVTTKLGPVKATFSGAVTITDMNPPESYRIAGEGKGGVAGFASGGADVHLAEDGDGTILTYAADAKVGGKIAQLGARLIDSTAKKLADQFFACFAEKAAGVGAPDALAAADAALGAPAAPGSAGSGAGVPIAASAPSAPDTGLPSTAAAPGGPASASPYRDGEPGGGEDLYRDAPAPPEAAGRGREDAGEPNSVPGGLLSEPSGEPLVGAAGQVTTGVDQDRLEIEEALHLREDSNAPRASVPGMTTDTTTPELGRARLGETHRPNAMERAEAGLEREAASGTLGGPMVWGLLVLAALIVIWFIAT